jgi:hypothetical protein
MTYGFPNQVVGAIGQAIDAIPGCRFVRAQLVGMTTAGGGYIVLFDGWSPSLHDVRIETRLTVHQEMAHVPELVLERLRPQLDTQWARSDRAAFLGRNTPFPLKDREPIEIDHLQVDASLLLVQLDGLRHDMQALDAVGDQSVLRILLRQPHRGKSSMSWRDVRIRETRDAMLLEYGHPVRTPGSRGGSADGVLTASTLSVAASVSLPDTVAQQIVGQPVSRLVSIHPALDRRTIRRVRFKERDVDIGLKPLNVLLGTLRGHDVPSARRLLMEMVHQTA